MTITLPSAAEALLSEPESCTLSTVRADGSVHVTPVRFTWDTDSGLARVMTVGGRAKTRNIQHREGSRAVVCQVSGPRWISLEGVAAVSADPERVAEGVRRYAKRYWSPPPPFPGMVVIEITVDRYLGLF